MMKKIKKLLSRVLDTFCLKPLFNATKDTDSISAHSEKATKFCEISTFDLSYLVPVKSTVEILQNIVAFLE